MVFDGLRKSLRNTFRRKSKKGGAPYSVDGKKLLPCKIALLDGTDVSINLQRDALGKDLLKRVYLHLDLVEKDYFGLQFMDAKQVPHWLDPTKKLKKQVTIGPPYTLHFRVKFYAPDPHLLTEELTRYHFFSQIKQDVRQGKLRPTMKQSIDLGAFSVQSELGDFDNTIHVGNYVSEFRLVPDQSTELEHAIEKKHRLVSGMNPAECEVNYLAIARGLEYYGMDRHVVTGEDNKEYVIGLTPHGIVVLKGDQKLGFHVWKSITNITFKQARFILCARTSESETQEYRYLLPTPHASKHLWKCAIEYHTFFRLIAAKELPERKSSLFRRNSRFGYSGRTLAQARKDDAVNGRKSMLIKRTRSERYAQRSTIGYIRIGSHVWARAINGDYYKGEVTALTDKVHIKFENGDTIPHDRSDENALVFDMDPNPNELKIGTRVIGHWSGLSAFLPGNITKIDGNKYHVLYDDGDRGTNRIEQMRILKPPLFFGPGSGRSKLQKKYSMKTTALIGSTTSNSISDDHNKVSVSADLNKPKNNRRHISEGDDDVFPNRNSPRGSPRNSKPRKTKGSSSPPLPHANSNVNQKWKADLKASDQNNIQRTQSASTNNNNVVKGPTRAHSLDQKEVLQKDTPPLNARFVHNSKTGNGYQITDL